MKPHLSVIIPAYNESENFKKNQLSQVYGYLKKQSYSFELLLVDDGSTDTTLTLLNDFAHNRPEVVVVAEPHRGKASTVRAGMMAAHGTFRLFTDFDQSTPIYEVEKMWPFFDRGYDVVIGSREVQGSAREKEPWYRHLMGKGFNFVVQLLAVKGIHDTQCGFKILSDKATKVLFQKLLVTTAPKKDAFTGAFDVELLLLAKRYNFLIAEVPVQWKHVQTKRVSPIKDSLRMFWQLVHLRLALIRGQYE